ncbi:MAG: AAA family ATPase, partial [Bacteroidales bacterium]|nr:AAA family ATPase [Bacteroidales bacterium]
KQTQKTHNRFNDRKTLIFKHIDTHNGDASVGMGSYVKIWGLMKEPCAVRSQFAVNNKLSMALFWIRPEEYIALDKKNRAFLWENFEIEIPDSPSFSQYQQLIIDIRNMMKTGVIKQKSFVELSSAADNEAGTDEEESMAVDSDESMNARMAKCVDLWETRKNIVLQGAPGTGKTYRVPELVVRLCSPEFDADRATRDELMEEYDKLKNDRRVMFTTFHQSMDYEDWLEGLRPVVDDGNQVTYRPEPGIFKQLCDEAEKPVSVNKGIDISRDATVWKVSLKGAGDNPVRTDCMKNGYIRIGWDYLGKDITEETDYGVGGGKIPLNAFINTMKTGDVVLSCYSNSIIDAIGVVTGDYEWHEEFKEYKRLRKVQWLVKGIHEDIVALNDGKTMTLSTVYRMNAMNIGDIKMLLDKHEKSESLIANTNPYVVVVDEINRGNVAKIFGELITLLEPDKRKGMKDAECVTLPYSKKPFCVPSNVYLIATMNTADRSLGAVDYAVRRRFAFVSVLPYEIDDENFHHDLFRRVSELFISNYDEYADSGFDVNVKLEPADTLCDEYRPEDVWIGHSYFIMKDEDEVRNRMEFEILPLLQEYVRDGVLTYEAQEKIDDLFQEYVVA